MNKIIFFKKNNSNSIDLIYDAYSDILYQKIGGSKIEHPFDEEYIFNLVADEAGRANLILNVCNGMIWQPGDFSFDNYVKITDIASNPCLCGYDEKTKTAYLIFQNKDEICTDFMMVDDQQKILQQPQEDQNPLVQQICDVYHTIRQKENVDSPGAAILTKIYFDSRKQSLL